MPRSARIDIPNILQHVIVRGIERRDIFADDDDRRQFVRRLSNNLVSTETDCLAWTLLNNHVHLLLRPRQTTLANFMRRLLTGYAVTFNLRHHRSGHLFQNRYKSIVCDEEHYLLELVRYIHLNPLRAGLIKTIDELDRYAWSGHAVLMGEGDLPGQATVEVLGRFGKSISVSRRRYRSFVEDGLAMGAWNNLTGPGRPLEPNPEAAEERELTDSRVLGRGDFVEQLLRRADSERMPGRVPLDLIIGKVCGKLVLSPAELTSQTRVQRVAKARSLICHIAFACGHRGVDIARRLGITGSGVTIAAQRGRQMIAEHPDFLAMIEG